MIKTEIEKIAENAKLIVNGYAFFYQNEEFITILNLEHPDCAMVINKKFEIIETNMDEIEQKIVIDLAKKNIPILEEENA